MNDDEKCLCQPRLFVLSTQPNDIPKPLFKICWSQGGKAEGKGKSSAAAAQKKTPTPAPKSTAPTPAPNTSRVPTPGDRDRDESGASHPGTPDPNITTGSNGTSLNDSELAAAERLYRESFTVQVSLAGAV